MTTKLGWIVGTLACLAVPVIARQAPASAQFEVASIKRNTSGNIGTGPPILPNGDVRLVNVPLRTLVLRAYPLQTAPAQVFGLPSWVESERYDVIAKGKAGASADEQQQMWRALLSDRTKLAAHYETREGAAYDLVFAKSNRTLGDGLKPSTLDCSGPPAPPAAPPRSRDEMRTLAMSRCNSFYFDRDGTLYGNATIDTLIKMLTGTAGRPIIDRTGLTGSYAITLRYQRNTRADAPPSPDDPPSLFTALPEQLGLKLESTKADVQVLVVDHIERPTED